MPAFTMQLNVLGGAANSVSHLAIAYGFVGTPSYDIGLTIDGLPYVIAPNGIKLTEPTPVATTVSSRYMNGTMQDAQRIYGTPAQALDSGVGGALTGYSAGAAAAFGGVVPANSSLIKVKSKTGTITDERNGLLDQWSGLFVVPARKAANVTAPFIWPAADLANRPWRAVDLDGLMAATTLYPALGNEVPWATLKPYYARLDLGPALTANVLGGAQYLSPYMMGDDAANHANYDVPRCRMQDAVFVGLQSQAWSDADRREAWTSVIQKGCQVGEPIVAFNLPLGEDGGHYGSQYAQCMAWLFATGRASEYSTWIPKVGGNPYGQYYAITAGQFAPHSLADDSKPYICRRRNVTSITNGGLTVTTQGMSPSGGMTGDGVNTQFMGLNLVRDSSGASALITSFTRGVNGADHTFGLSAPISGLTIGNAVYGAEVTPMAVGTIDFIIRNIGAYPHHANPSPSSDYRNTQVLAMSDALIHNIGMHGAAMDKFSTYTQRAMSGSPGNASTMVGTLNAAIAGSPNTIAGDFYAAYASAIYAKPQLGL